jgi:hypothetical protein
MLRRARAPQRTPMRAHVASPTCSRCRMTAKLGRMCTSVSQQLRAMLLYSAGTPEGNTGRLCFLYTLRARMGCGKAAWAAQASE